MESDKPQASRVEVLPGTIRSHGGPHVFRDGVCSCGKAERGNADEVELMTEDEARSYVEIRNATVWSRFDDGQDT